MIKNLVRLFHTIRYIPPRALCSQVWQAIRPLTENPASFAAEQVTPFPGVRWTPKSPFLPPGTQVNTADFMKEGFFFFLNRTERLGWPPRWNCDELPRHWRYYLHYFDYIWALNFEDASALARHWIEHHPLDGRHFGWDAYPISLRLMNWCTYFFDAHREETEKDHELTDSLWRSILTQAEWLRRHFEWNIGGNHLLENAGALAVAGACFKGDCAEEWLHRASGVLEEEVPKQFRADGTHISRSPMYHARMAYLVALLLNTGDPTLANILTHHMPRVMAALAGMTHADGKIALFNDSAIGTYNHPPQLADYVGRITQDTSYQHAMDERFIELSDAGFYGARSPSGTRLLCDGGPSDTHYIPGHGHGGIFSFELTHGHQRIIVDAGAYGYEASRIRHYCRSTRAHNTLEIGHRDQAEYWGAFRVGRRRLPRGVRFEKTQTGFVLAGAHRGYGWSGKRIMHRRQFCWHDDGLLMVRDRVTSPRGTFIASRLHLHPDCTIEHRPDNVAIVYFAGGACTIRFIGDGLLQTDESFYCPEFGKVLNNQALVFMTHGRDVDVGYCIYCDKKEEHLSANVSGEASVGGKSYSW